MSVCHQQRKLFGDNPYSNLIAPNLLDFKSAKIVWAPYDQINNGDFKTEHRQNTISKGQSVFCLRGRTETKQERCPKFHNMFAIY